jgi:amino acid efflux transporter
VHAGGLSFAEGAIGLAVVGSMLCLLLLAMVGWKSLYALVMLAGLWLFLPRRKLATER